MLQTDLDNLADWANIWQMSFNASNCNTIKIAPTQHCAPNDTEYSLHGQNSQDTDREYLIVTIKDDIFQTQQVEAVAAI
jgi:hypothetical protein